MINPTFFPPDFIIAHFISRPNRFVVRILIDKKETGASLPNPGKLGELFIPGARLYVQRMSAEVKYSYRVIAVESLSGEVIMLDTHTNNRIAEYLINSAFIPSLKGYHVKKREVTVGHSRFDLLLENVSGELLYCEVKSCTLFGGRLAMFPDAITSRGKRHVEELGKMALSGIKTAVVFVIQSANIQYFSPDYHTDILFSETLYKYRKQIKIIPVRAGWNNRLELNVSEGEVPLLWDLYEKEGRSGGGFIIMLFNIPEEKNIPMDLMGNLQLSTGYYIYISYESEELKSRAEKYKRIRKKCRNFTDYLRRDSLLDMLWIIRTGSEKIDLINHSILQISHGMIQHDSSSRLYYFRENPRLMRDFQELLLDLKMRIPLIDILGE
ncbi:MAG: DNA/RNA nuclease SfsA [Spirochaetaceae bacterium]|nr:DNA/RNA nuclease SfsA [Spirochaetaceae bacterium]